MIRSFLSILVPYVRLGVQEFQARTKYYVIFLTNVDSKSFQPKLIYLAYISSGTKQGAKKELYLDPTIGKE